MPREFNQKIKLLRMMELLQMETDEAHPLTTQQICRRMELSGIPCERRTLTRDIEALNENGYAVGSRMSGHEKVYYAQGEHFSLDDIRLLMRALRAAPFLTDERTRELTRKAAALGGSYSDSLMKEDPVCYDVCKGSCGELGRTLDIIGQALEGHGKLSFCYFEPDENGGRIFRRGGGRYVSDPLRIVYSDGFFYLLCHIADSGETEVFRADRMTDAQAEEGAAAESAAQAEERPETENAVQAESGDEAGYADIFGGSPEECTLKFDDSLIGAVYDRFGSDLKMERTGENECRAHLRIRTSPAFWGWLFSFSGRMQLTAPSELAEKYMTWCSVIAQSIAETMIRSADGEDTPENKN